MRNSVVFTSTIGPIKPNRSPERQLQIQLADG